MVGASTKPFPRQLGITIPQSQPTMEMSCADADRPHFLNEPSAGTKKELTLGERPCTEPYILAFFYKFGTTYVTTFCDLYMPKTSVRIAI